MHSETATAIQDLANLSLQGKIIFPEVIRRLAELGVERYHADYSRHETTYYLPGGESCVVPLEHPPYEIAQEFSAAGVEAAIRQSQRGEIDYLEFVRQSQAAGCVGYFVQITGRRVIYFGRLGDAHVEPFPAAPQN